MGPGQFAARLTAVLINLFLFKPILSNYSSQLKLTEDLSLLNEGEEMKNDGEGLHCRSAESAVHTNAGRMQSNRLSFVQNLR